MAKDISEIINSAAIVRDETGEAANTAARVGGSIADIALYIQENVITPLLAAQSQASSSERIAEYAKKIAEEAAGKITASLNKDAEQDGKISSLEAKDATHDTKIADLEERVLKYLYPKIYQLNEGAGARKFDGFYKGSASVSPERKEASEDGYSYKVVFKSGSFYLQEISPSGLTMFLYSSWNKISLPNNKSIDSSESYAQRDCLYYIFVSGEGSTYYYIDSNGVAREQSATYLLRKLVDKNASSIAALQGNDTAQDGEIATLHERDTALDDKISALEAKDIEHNDAIVRNATVEYYDTSVTDGPSRINTRATFKFFGADNNQLFMATLFGAGNGYPGLLSLKNKIKLDGYADTFPQNPVASSESNGLMSAADKAKVGNYPEQFVLDLGILNSQSEGENIAAASEVAGNRNISFIKFQVHGVRELKTTLIMQWPNGINETAQIMCVDKAQWRRNVTGATGVKGATTNAFKWERTAPHSIDYDEQRRMIKLKDYENQTVSQEVELPLATSSQPGLMSSDDKTKLDRLAIDTTWAGQHANAFTEAGEFHIYGERTNANDGLPILNAASGHTIDARLTVLDSSLTNGTGEKTDTVVTQVLRLSNRTGGDGHIYVRTAQAATKSQLATPSSTAWGTWEKLMGVFEKNMVTNIADLDTYTTNGMYSGLFADTTLQTLGGLQFTPGDTFLMVTINGYAASAFGTPQLTQMLYQLPSKQGSSGDYSSRMYVRTAWWNVNVDPKKWEFSNWDRLVTSSELVEEVGYLGQEDSRLNGLIAENTTKIESVEDTAIKARDTASFAQTKNAEQDARLSALENPPAPDYAEMIIEAPATRHYKLFYDVRCIRWLEIDGEEAELPIITEDRAASYYAVLSQGRHVVRFRPKDGNMSDGTPYKERQGLLGWCDDNFVTEITLPEGWNVINTKMFEASASLRRVNLPSTIREVRYGAFGGCNALEEIVLPPSVETIGHIIAHDCPALKRIVLGGNKDIDIIVAGTLAQSCDALECVEFRAGGTVKFTTTNNTFVHLPQLARFIVRGNLPTFECSQPFTSIGYVGSDVAAEVRWIFTAEGRVASGTKWQESLLSQCGFTVKKILSYTLN